MTRQFCQNAACVICAFLCFGCDNKQAARAYSPSSIKRTPIFDLVASTPDYSNAIAALDRDLPGDEWSSTPFHINNSRGRRVAPIGKKILEEVRPKLKQMSVVELAQCLKVQDGSGFITNYIKDDIYPQGNEMIIAEMRSRPGQQRKTLLGLPFDDAYLDTGCQGHPVNMDEIIREIASSPAEVHGIRPPNQAIQPTPR